MSIYDDVDREARHDWLAERFDGADSLLYAFAKVYANEPLFDGDEARVPAWVYEEADHD